MIALAECAGYPLRRCPCRGDDDAADNDDLTNIDFCRKHSPPHSPAQRRRRDENDESGKPSIEIKYRAGNERDIDQDRSVEKIEDQSWHSVIERFNSALTVGANEIS